MDLFRWLRADPEKRLDPGIVAKLIEIEARQKAQEAGLKSLDMEWSEWYDKFRHMYARLAKRIKDASAVVDASNGDGDARQSGYDAPESTIRPHLGYGHPQLPIRSPEGTRTRRNY